MAAPPAVQTALILQGSAALGAYEAGVIKGLFDNLGLKPDIIAATSSGAINAAILVSYFQQTGSWNGAADRVLDYWYHKAAVATPFGVPLFPEDVRRYYSTKQFFFTGLTSTYSPPIPVPDSRFNDNTPGDSTNNVWYKYDDTPLSNAIQSTFNGAPFINFPLKTSPPEPRLLAVATEAQYGQAVTFDSYTLKSTFNYCDPVTCKPTDVNLEYPAGMGPEHILASCTVPLIYDYQQASGRYFWDGWLVSNTPLRELIQSHQDYWTNTVHAALVPDLEVYIVDVWPSETPSLPTDHDGVKDRMQDLIYCDRSDYDKKVGMLVTDLITLSKSLMQLAADSGAPAPALAAILNRNASSKKRDGTARTFRELLQGGVTLRNVTTIQRKHDPNGVWAKWTDLTFETIDQMIKEGMDYQKKSCVSGS